MLLAYLTLFCLDLDAHILIDRLKTTEVTQLQLGESTKNFQIVVSTMAEAEYLADWLIETKAKGKNVNVCVAISKTGVIMANV